MALSKPALLVLASTFPARLDDGTPAFVHDLAHEESVDYDVTVLTPRVDGAAARESIDGVNVVRYPYFFRRWEDLADGAILDNLRARPSRWLQVAPLLLAQYFAVRRTVREIGPVAVHAHWLIPQGLIATLAAPAVPRLVTLHGADIYALRGKLAMSLKRWTARRAARVSVVNPDMAEVVQTWGIGADVVKVIPMGVPLRAVKEVERPRARTAGEIVVVGRLVEKKGIRILLDALRSLHHHIEWHLTVVGDGPLRQELERRASGMPVTFIGQKGRKGVLKALAHAGVVVVPSVRASSGDREGLPVTLLEAAAMGSAIVASALPGITEVVTDDETGLLVDPGDREQLRDAIATLLNDADLRDRLGAAAAERAHDFSTVTIGSRYRDLLGEVAGTPAAPTGRPQSSSAVRYSP